MIARLRKALSTALHRERAQARKPAQQGPDAGSRIDDARRRLRETIPPRED